MADRTRTVSIVIQARNEATAAFNSILGSLTSFAGLAAVATAASAAIAVAITKVTRAAMEQEDADIRLAASLASIGQNTPAVRAEIGAMVSELERLTAVGDETIQNALGPLIRTAHLQGQALREATAAALDYAAGTGGDVAQAATQLANLVAKGAGRLAEINTKFDEGTPAAERLAKTVAAINQQFGGMAAALGASLSGALKRLANDWDNLEQAVGKAFVENVAFRDVLETLSQQLQAGTKWVEEHRGAIDSLADAFAKIAAAGLQVSGTIGEIFFKLGKLDAPFEALIDKVLGTHLQTGMRQIEGALASGSKSLADAGQKIGEGLKSAEKSVVDVAAGIQNKVVPAAIAALSPLDAALKAIGLQSLPEINAQAQKLNAAFVRLSQALASGQITPEQFDALKKTLADMADQLAQAGAQLPAVFEHVNVAANSSLTVMQEVALEMKATISEAAGQMAAALVDAALSGELSFRKFGQIAKDIIRQIVAEIVHALVVKLVAKIILAAATHGAGAAAQHGGDVRGGIPGLDSVRAFLTPGEIVLPKSRVEDFEAMTDFARLVRRAEGVQGRKEALAGFHGTFNILPRNRDAEIAELIGDINRAVERRGYRLISSEVLA